MKRSPILATLIVALFLIAVPVFVIRRLADGLLPTQPYDIVLAVAVLASILIAKAVLDRTNRVDKLIENRLSPNWQAASLVEQSVFGVGLTPRASAQKTDTDPRLFQLAAPGAPIGALLPPPIPEQQIGRVRPDSDERGQPRLRPTIRQHDRSNPPIIATEEYVIARGDTFWSIAESRLGDGRRWSDVEAINIGREVAPNQFLRQGDTPRIGWLMLVPVALDNEVEA